MPEFGAVPSRLSQLPACLRGRGARVGPARLQPLSYRNLLRAAKGGCRKGNGNGLELRRCPRCLMSPAGNQLGAIKRSEQLKDAAGFAVCSLNGIKNSSLGEAVGMKPLRRAWGCPKHSLGWVQQRPQGQHPKPGRGSGAHSGLSLCPNPRGFQSLQEHPEPCPISHPGLRTAFTLPRACTEGD